MMRSNHPTRLFVLAGLALSSSAFGATRSWLNAAGGFVSTPANWSPAAMPVAADILNFNLGTTYSVVFDASVPTVDSDNFFGPGAISISATSPHTATTQFGVLSGGTVNLTSGSFTSNGTISIGSSGSGTFNVTGPTASMNGTSLISLLRVGNSSFAGATGTLNVLSGALVQTIGGVSVGAFSGATGNVLVSGSASGTPSRLITTDATAGDITLGTAGNGSMTVSVGGTVTAADDFSIAPNPSFSGNLDVSVSSTVTVAGDITIGATGSLTNSGIVAVGGAITNGGIVTMHNGTTSASNFNALNGSTTTASGRIDAPVLGPLATQTAALILNGSLDVGRSVAGGFSWQTALNVGTHALTIRDNARSRLGDVTLSGGSITSTGGLGTVLAGGDSLVGFGTINAPIQLNPSAPVTVSGTALTLNGLVTSFNGTPVTITGTRVNFGPSSSFTGQGTISTMVQNLGAIAATGPLTLGNGTGSGVSTVSGSLNVGLHHVTLLDSNGLGVGQCTLGGGNLELIGTFAGRSLNTSGNSHLRGFGTLTSLLVQNLNGGQISPGNPGATGTGAIFVTGNYNSGDALNPAGTLNLDLRDSESIDQMIITGSAAVAGTLNITLDPAFSPAPGERFTFFRAASVSGTFDILNIPAGSVILYNPDNVQILFPCPSDFNQDGTVDFFDYLDFVDAFSSADPSADFNGDTTIDFFDYLDFVDAFSLGC